MSFLYGEYKHSTDNKGRLIIPAKLRSPTKETSIDQFVVTRGFDKERCLYMFPPLEWQKIEKKLRALPINKSSSRSVLRIFFSGASIVDCDRQGRVLIPKKLLEFSEVKSDAVIVGVSTRLEIWAAEKWNSYYETAQDDYANLAEELFHFDMDSE